MKSYDIIGDIHGHAEELCAILARLGYHQTGGTYLHPGGRRVIFLGDYIDRGPEIRRTLEIVRGMVESGDALAILGNHEINAMRFHTTDAEGRPLRPHTDKNIAQHSKTLRQIPDNAEMAGWMQWFAGLPLSIEIPGLRAVHAAWDPMVIREMRACGPLVGTTLEKFSRKGSPAYEKISRLVNGPEAVLPDGCLHMTADGTMRPEIRVKWWINLDGMTCRQAIFPDRSDVPEMIPESVPALEPYDNKCPVFFGHYALRLPAPVPQSPKIACLDYGTGKGGFLCAYRWDGEQEIDPGKFVVAPSETIPPAKEATPHKCPTPHAEIAL